MVWIFDFERIDKNLLGRALIENDYRQKHLHWIPAHWVGGFHKEKTLNKCLSLVGYSFFCRVST